MADRVGVPEDEAHEDEEQHAAEESGAAQQVVAPQVPVAGDGGGDGVGDVVVDGRRQGLGEGAQGEHLAVEDLLGGQGAGAVQDGSVAADQVVAGGVPAAWVWPVSRRISGWTSATAMSSGSATSMRLSGATTVTRQKPVAAVVLTCVDP